VLLAGPWPSLASDVDFADGLRAAGELGLGEYTAALRARTYALT
jgi:hypothetical protein